MMTYWRWYLIHDTTLSPSKWDGDGDEDGGGLGDGMEMRMEMGMEMEKSLIVHRILWLLSRPEAISASIPTWTSIAAT